jgi:hypothetical protein
MAFFPLFGGAKVVGIYVLNKVLIRFVNHRILLISNDICNDIFLQIRFHRAVLDYMFFGFGLHSI